MENLPSNPGIGTTVETPLNLVDLPAPLLAKILSAVGVCDAHRVAAATATIMRDGLVQHVRAWLPATRQLSWLKNGNVDRIPIVKCALVELLAHELLCNHLYARVITEEEAIEQGLPYE